MLDQSVIDSFHLMWDAFPDPVTLIYRNHEIIAANVVARDNGRTAGIRCYTLFTPETHRGCRAARSLKSQSAEYLRKKGRKGNEILLYWLPIPGNPEYLVHVSVGAVSNCLDHPSGENVDLIHISRKGKEFQPQ